SPSRTASRRRSPRGPRPSASRAAARATRRLFRRLIPTGWRWSSPACATSGTEAADAGPRHRERRSRARARLEAPPEPTGAGALLRARQRRHRGRRGVRADRGRRPPGPGALRTRGGHRSDRRRPGAAPHARPGRSLRGRRAPRLPPADGTTVLRLATWQDPQRVNGGDRGPNTGGMGAYSPAPVVGPALHERVMREIIEPVVRGLARQGTPYVGVLYAGLMVQGDRAK